MVDGSKPVAATVAARTVRPVGVADCGRCRSRTGTDADADGDGGGRPRVSAPARGSAMIAPLYRVSLNHHPSTFCSRGVSLVRLKASAALRIASAWVG